MNSYKHHRLIFLFIVLVLSTTATEAQQLRLSLEEVAQNSGLIFVGTVERTESRFNDQRTMIFTDVYFKDLSIVHATSHSVQKRSATVQLTYAGGQVGEYGIEVSDTPRLSTGHRYLIFMSNDGLTYANPIIGGNQGVFEVIKDSVSQKEYLLSPGGKAVLNVNSEGITLSERQVESIDAGIITAQGVVPHTGSAGSFDQPALSKAPGDSAATRDARTQQNEDPAQPLELREFLGFVKGTALESRLETRSFKRDGEGAFYQRTNGAMEAQPLNLQTRKPATMAGDGFASSSPPASGLSRDSSIVPMGGALGACGYQTLPIVMEQVPASFWSYSIVNDNMYTWNVFMDLFRYTDSDGFYGNNSQNEFSAFVSDANLFSVYGFHWNGALAITVMYFSVQCGRFSQTDVAWNSAYSWTSDPDFAIGNSGVILLRSVNQHESGHVWGLQDGVYQETYDYDQATVMHAYYYNIVEDGWGVHASDAYLIRRQYQNQTGIIARKDVGVESYYAANGLHDSTTNSPSYSPGQSITLNGVTAENMSNTAVSDMRIRFYLSSNRTISTSDYQLGTYWFWTTFPAEAYNVSNYTTTIPANIPPGVYYVGAIISVDGFGSDDYPYNNAESFYSSITITASGPANDNFANAQAITGNSGGLSGSNLDATKESGEPNHGGNSGGHSVWYRWQAPASGSASIDTLGSNFDTLLGVYTGSSVNALTTIGSNDDDGGLTSRVPFNAVNGTVYYIAVDGFGGATGNISLNWSISTSSSGSWSPISTPPVPVTNCLLLTDGRVMCQRLLSNQWYALTPNSAGSYAAGTWAQLASMPANYQPLYYASAVLPDGRVIVEGGEYNQAVGPNAVWTNLGAIYDPVANSWTTVTPPSGWTSIGDASGIVLADGTFFLSDCCSTKTAKFNASSLTWTAFGTGYQGLTNDESGWVLLPGNTLLTVDAFPANSRLSERFNPTTGVWSSAGNTPVSLADNDSARGNDASFEIGPGALRPNGTVFYVGANPNVGTACCSGLAHTAIFSTGTNTWSSGPDIPNSYAGNDAPASVLPNGNVLIQVAPPASSTSVFGSPSRFYEFDGSALTLVNSPANVNYPSYVGGMLVLPTGQVLFTHQTTDVEIYTPTGTANSAWLPTITNFSASLQRGSTYTISGTQFNGLTQGGYYGDDLQAATNYPLVRITNTATGHVFYARTHGHSSMGVATGSSVVSTSFDVPSGAELGASTLQVVANGIASSAVSVTIATASSLRIDTLTPKAGRISGGQQLHLTGAFAGLSTVTLGGTSATWVYANGAGDTSAITVTTPAHAAGAVQIALTPAVGSGLSQPNAFAYLPTVFTDDTITIGQTTAKAQHIIELRQAVDAMRAVAGLSGAPWTDPGLAAGNPIKAIHILDLRTFLNDAATRLGYSTSAYTDPGLTAGFVIKRIHIEELRQRIRTIAG